MALFIYPIGKLNAIERAPLIDCCTVLIENVVGFTTLPSHGIVGSQNHLRMQVNLKLDPPIRLQFSAITKLVVELNAIVYLGQKYLSDVLYFYAYHFPTSHIPIILTYPSPGDTSIPFTCFQCRTVISLSLQSIGPIANIKQLVAAAVHAVLPSIPSLYQSLVKWMFAGLKAAVTSYQPTEYNDEVPELVEGALPVMNNLFVVFANAIQLYQAC